MLIRLEGPVRIEVETDILLIPLALFKQWIGTYQPLKQYVFSQITQRITSVTDLLEDIAFKPIPYRIADFLIKHSDEKNTMIRITHEQLAIELGTAREVISRSLKSFTKQNILISHRGYLEITDRNLLIQFQALYNHSM